jgi:hypothetical protein
METNAPARTLARIMSVAQHALQNITTDWTALPRPALSSEQAQYVVFVQTEAWAKLHAFASDLAYRRQETTAALPSLTWQISSLQQFDASLKDLRRFTKTPMAEHPGWNALRSRLEEELRLKNIDDQRLRAMVDRFARLQGKEIGNMLQTQIGRTLENLVSALITYTSSVMGTIIAERVVQLNLAAAETVTPPTMVEQWCDDTEQRMTKAEGLVWKSLREDHPAIAALYAMEMYIAAEHSLIACVNFAASLSKQRKAMPESNELTLLAIRIGDNARRLLRRIAMGRYLSIVLCGAPEWSVVGTWLRAAHDLPYAPRPNTRSITVEQFLAHRRETDTLVSVHGVLGDLVIDHQGGKQKNKLVSSARLVGSTGAAITIALPYIKLDSAGMVPGAAVRITGQWHDKIEWLQDQPGLVLDRENYETLGQTSAYEWATAALRKVCAVVPHSLAAGWSWEPGGDGAGNILRYGTWYRY